MRIDRASFLTADEKRAAVGYGPLLPSEVPAPFDAPPSGGTGVVSSLKFSPEQPRADAGNSDGGQWVDAGGGSGGFTDSRVLSDATPDNLALPGARLAQNDGSERYRVNISEEDARGGHTVKDHVGKSDDELLTILEQEVIHTPRYSYYKEAQSSFISRESANDFVNRILERNAPKVDAVASGLVDEAWLEDRFGFPTGKQAFRPGPEEPIYMRPTFKVGVLIRHDQRSKRGYTVHTAYPLNDSNADGGYSVQRQ